MTPITLYCRTCQKIVLYSSDTARLRAYATEHHGRHPGHWIQAEITNDITHRTHTVDVANRHLAPEARP